MNPIRILSFDAVADAVADLCGKAACDLPSDVLKALQSGREKERGETARDFFDQYLENARIAREDRMPLCQDTGFAVFFIELGDAVRLDRGTLTEALTEGTRRGYGEHYLRKSIVNDPLFDRKNTTDNTPPVIHLELVPGDQLRIGRPGGAGEKTAAAVDDGDSLAGSGTPGQFSNGAGKNPGVTAAQRLLAPGMKFQNKLTHNTSSLRTT